MTTAHRAALRAQAERPGESRPLRVAVEAIATAPGGGLSYLRNQLPELERQGISLLVFARSAVAADLRDVLRSPASRVRVVDGSSLAARLRFIHAQLVVEAQRWGADVLYCPGSTAPLWSRGIPTVVCVQNPHLFRADAPRSLRLAIQRPVAWLSAFRASEFVHISASTAAEFSRYSALRRSYSILLSGLGQTEQALQPTMGICRDAIVVVSNLYAYKRIDEVLAAFASERGLHDSYELVIAGEELQVGLRRRLENLAHALDCAESVRFTGFLMKTELLDLYQRAAVLVSASREEAFPLPPGEALAMSVPVVLSDIPPHRELYGRWARLVTPGDVAGLGQAMSAAVRQGCVPDDQVEELKATFSWARNGEALAHILRRAATTGPVPAKRKLRAVQLAALPRAVRTVIGRATQAGPRLPSSRDHESNGAPGGGR
jgi:glycosyltransferase involved in cell wall biosynthesis